MLMNVAKLSVEGKEVRGRVMAWGSWRPPRPVEECALAGAGRILGMWMGQSRAM